LGLDIFRMFK